MQIEYTPATREPKPIQKFPYLAKNKNSPDIVVLFIDTYKGITVSSISFGVGHYSEGWSSCFDSCWVPAFGTVSLTF